MKIINIYWQRANLHLVLDEKINGEVKLVSKNSKIKLDYNDKEVFFNIANTPEGQALNASEYNLEINNKYIEIDDSLLNDLMDKSRNFYFERNTEVCLVDFNIDENRKFILNINYYKKNYKHYKESFKNKFIRIIKKTFKPVAVLLMNITYHIVRLFKFGKNNVLFLTENSDRLDGNLKILYEKYINLKEYKVKYYSKDVFHIHGGMSKLIHFIKVTNMVALSDIIIVDNYVPTLTLINFSKSTRYVQLWHAGIGFKSVGFARFGLDGSPNPFKSSHRRYTDAIVDQENLIDIYKEVYGVSKNIFKSYGMPRLEGYLNKEKIDETIKKIYSEHSELRNKKIILFSPTYRGNGSKDAYYDYSLINLDEIYNYAKKNDFIFVIKMHPFIKKKIEIKKDYSDRIIDLSKMDINDLIYISDIMITDYSSCAYEYSLFDRPLVFYRFDKSFYEFTRPMHTVDEFTSKQYEVLDFKELMNVLNKLKDIKIEDRFKNIKNKQDSNSCEKIIKLLK